MTVLQKKDAPLKKEDIALIRDELRMPLEIKSVTTHALHVNLMGCTQGKVIGGVISNSIVLKMAEVLRPNRPTR